MEEILFVGRNPGKDVKSPYRVSSGFEGTSFLHYINVKYSSISVPFPFPRPVPWPREQRESKCLFCSSLYILLEILQLKLNINHLKCTL